MQDGEKGVEAFHNVGVLAAHFKAQAYGRLTTLVYLFPPRALPNQGRQRETGATVERVQ